MDRTSEAKIKLFLIVWFILMVLIGCYVLFGNAGSGLSIIHMPVLSTLLSNLPQTKLTAQV